MYLLPLLVACSWAISGCGTNEQEYVEANEAILDQLPEYPGAVELERVDSPYILDEAGLFERPDGWLTLVTYRVEDATTDEIMAFYVTALAPEWRGSRLSFAQAMLCRGDALISLNLENLPGPGTFDLAVDHRHGRGMTRAMSC